MAKRLVVPSRETIDVWHVFDFESESEQHRRNFQEALRQIRDANRTGKRIRYHSAYGNFAFDLWIVLRRRNAVHCGDRHEYLRQINDAYGTSFRKMDEYKREANFKAILSKISLGDVADAVERTKAMNAETETRDPRTAEHCGSTYHLGNPYTELHVPVERILRETGILHAKRTGKR